MKQKCAGCRDGQELGFDFTMAFQPIVDIATGKTWGYEALVRGVNGLSASEILSKVDDTNRYRFDQACRVKAIELASTLFPKGEGTRLSINFMPNAVYEPLACIQATLKVAARTGFDTRDLMFEFTENERIDADHVQKIVASYKRMGFTTALDDFGAGYAGLVLLAKFQPDLIKLDMDLIRGVESSPARQSIIAAVMTMAGELGMTVLAEGVETDAEVATLRAAGVRLLQGYYFARPELEHLPAISLRAAA